MTRPRVLVVHDSRSGSTSAVAQQVAAGMGGAADVEVVDARTGTLTEDRVEGADLVVVGAPTHGARLRVWLAGLRTGRHRARVVAFDARTLQDCRLPGAARTAVRDLRAKGFEPLAAPVSFHVVDGAGRLAVGELDRARAWGCRLVAVLSALTASPAAGR